MAESEEELKSPNIHLIPDVKSWLAGKDPDAEKDDDQRRGVVEDEMVGGHILLSEHEFEQTPGDSEGPGSLVCCQESDTT